MSKEIIISEQIENLAKKILQHMCKRHYASYSAVCLFRDFEKYRKEDFLGALAFLVQEKLLAHKEKDKPVSLQYFELLYEGKPIRHTMINDAVNSETFGQIFYENTKHSVLSCYEHLERSLTEQTDGYDDCQYCFSVIASCVCYDHNQSLAFCQKCREQAKQNKLEAERIGKDKFITQKLQEHNKKYWGV